MPGVAGARTVKVNVPIPPGGTNSSAVVATRFAESQPTFMPSSANFSESPRTPRLT